MKILKKLDRLNKWLDHVNAEHAALREIHGDDAGKIHRHSAVLKSAAYQLYAAACSVDSQACSDLAEAEKAS